MANYITLNSKFIPYTYDQMLKTAMAAQEAHDKTENAYLELGAQAGELEGLLNSVIDQDSIDIINNYNNSIKSQADILASSGITPELKRNLAKARTYYADQIAPLTDLYKKREELIKEQRSLKQKDSSIIFNKDADMLSLSTLKNNPNWMYEVTSGDNITKDVSTAVSNLLMQGYTPNDIIKFIDNGYQGYDDLSYIMNQALDKSGVTKWNNADAYNRATEAAALGLWHSINSAGLITSKSSSGGDDNKKEKSNKFLSNQEHLVGVGKEKTTQMKKDIEALEALIANPDLYYQIDWKNTPYDPGAKLKYGDYGHIGNLMEYQYNPDDIMGYYYAPNKKNYDRIFLEYGINGLSDFINGEFVNTLEDQKKSLDSINKSIEEAKRKNNQTIGDDGLPIVKNGLSFEEGIDEIKKRIKKTAVSHKIYNMNMVDYSEAGDRLRNILSNYSQHHPNTPILYEYNPGSDTKGSSIKSKKLKDYITDDITGIDYIPNVGIVVTSIDGKKDRSVVISMEALDNGGQALVNGDNGIKQAIEKGDLDLANADAEALIEALYMRLNTMNKNSGKTDNGL